MARYTATALTFMACLTACGGGSGTGDGGDVDGLFPLTVPTDVAVVDLDGDGRADVLTLEQRSTSRVDREGRLLVYRQTSPGVFAAPDVYQVGTYPWHWVVADVDGDGAPDAVITDPDAEEAWMLRQEAGNRGHFAAPVLLATGVHAYEAAVADLNGDGAVDIALPQGNTNPARVILLYQDSSSPGAFLPAEYVALPAPAWDAAAGDLDQDGHPDLVVSIRTAGGGATAPTVELAYLPQLPNGDLGAVRILASHTGLNVARMVVADYEGDGAQDLLVYFTPYSSTYRATLAVVRQAVLPGAFLPVVNTTLGDTRGLDDAVFADLNRDARPDAAVAGFFPVGSPSKVQSRVNLFTQAGGGSFAMTTVHEMPVSVSRIAAGDVNGDGAIDLVAFAGEDGCQVMLQSPTAPGIFSGPRPLR